MKYTKTAAHLDQLGKQARKLRQEMADATDAVADTREELKGYNERRREQTAKLREILSPVVAELQAGGTVNGVKGLHAWAAWYNPTAKDGKNAARQIMRIVNAPEKNEGDIKSPIHLNFDKIAKEMESGRKVMVTCGDFKYELMKTPFLNKNHITLSIADTRPIEVVLKKGEEKKPIKHARTPKGMSASTWCRTKIMNGNTAHQQRHATCPFCIAAMAAGIVVINPEISRRWLKKQIAEFTRRIPDLQSRVDNCLPEYRDHRWEGWKENIVKWTADVERWTKELAELPTTPEEAIEAAKQNKETAEMNELTYQIEQVTTEPVIEAVPTKVTVKLSEAQAREVTTVGLPTAATLNKKRLIFHGNYEEDARAMVVALENRIETLNKEAAALIEANRDLYFESDMGASEPARQVKGQVVKLNGAAKACDAAMEAIAYGSLDDEHNVLSWYEERKDARHGWITQEASEVAINALLGCVPKDATLEEATAALEKFTALRNEHQEWHPYVTANWAETLRKLVRDLTPETEEVV